jgi:arylsulfatase A-like enzyme
MARNLIVIVADTLRHPELVPWGYDGQRMPFLASLLPRAFVPPHVLASSNWTPPSHVSLLSGTNPWETQYHLVSSVHVVPPVPFLADRWREEGGESAAFSANFLVAPALGTVRGYDTYNPGLPTVTAGFALQGLQAVGFEQLLYSRMSAALRDGQSSATQRRAGRVQAVGVTAHRLLFPFYSGARLEHSLRRYLRQRRRHLPLHLLINLMEAHEPYLPSGLPRFSPLDPGYLPTVNYARHTGYLGHDPHAAERLRSVYFASLGVLDHRLASIFQVLQASDLLRDALVLVVSDHGQCLGEHGFTGHAFYLYDELVRIPAYLWQFQDGRPVSMGTPPNDWVDHRHLYDLLISYAGDETPWDAARTLADSRAARGPAVSFWEGPVPRVPGGLVRRLPDVPNHRAVRFEGGGESVEVWDDGRFPPTELGELAARLVRAPMGAGSGDTSAQHEAVSRRLRSWGYE